MHIIKSQEEFQDQICVVCFVKVRCGVLKFWIAAEDEEQLDLLEEGVMLGPKRKQALLHKKGFRIQSKKGITLPVIPVLVMLSLPILLKAAVIGSSWFAPAVIGSFQIPFIVWIIRNKMVKRSMTEEELKTKGFVDLKSKLTWLVIGLSGGVLFFLCAGSFSSVFGAILSLDKLILIKIAGSAILLTIGDIAGKNLRKDGYPLTPFMWAVRVLLVLFVVGPAIGMTIGLMIAGLNIYVPSVGSELLTYNKLLRSIVAFSSGAFFVSTLYAFFVPPLFEKWAISSLLKKATVQKEIALLKKARAKYTLRVQLKNALEGVTERWWIFIPNFIYINVLPPLLREIASSAVITGVNIYVSWKSSRSDLGGGFWKAVWYALIANKKWRKLSQS